MRCLILAAGRGTRISRYLGGRPKCTVDIGGEPLIAYTVQMLREQGVGKIGLVLGYQQQVIRDALCGQPVDYRINPFFDVTNSIASAWFARDFISPDEDLLVMNGDVFLEKDLLAMILAQPLSPVMFADDSRREEADYKFLYRNERLEKYGKELTGDDITGEYIGAARIAAADVPAFLAGLDACIADQQHGLWWENVLYGWIPQRPVYVVNTDGRFWAEVDYVEDYERILRYRGYRLDADRSVVRPIRENE